MAEKQNETMSVQYPSEQVRKSIELAEAIVRAEQGVEIGRKNWEHYRNRGVSYEHYSDPRAEGWGKRLSELQWELKEDPLAEKLLPQARTIVPLQEARRETIQETRFGEFVEAIQHQLLIICGAKGFENPRLFAGTHYERHWKDFVAALNAGDKTKLMESLLILLDFVARDMRNVEFSKAAPGYINPDLPPSVGQRYTYLVDLPRLS